MNPFPPPAGSKSFSAKPMAVPDGQQQYGTMPMQVGQAQSTMPMQIPQGGGGDFGPQLPGQPVGQPGNGTSIVNGRLAVNGQMAPNVMANAMQNRPTITDPNIDPSVRNSAVGDGFSGARDGFLYAGGQRMMPQTGSAAEDQATLYQFGVRNPQNAAAYGAAGGSPVPNGPAPSGAGAGGFQGGIDALRAGGPSPGMGQATQDMRYQMGGGLPPLAQGGAGGNRNRIIEALMRQYGSRR